MSFIKEFWEFLKIRKKYWLLPIIMCFIYFIILTPISFLIRVFGKDLLNLKFSKKINSYWTKRIKDVGPMRKQF